MVDILIRLRVQAKLAKKEGNAATFAFLSEAADELEQARFLLRLVEIKLKKLPADVSRETMVNGHG